MTIGGIIFGIIGNTKTYAIRFLANKKGSRSSLEAHRGYNSLKQLAQINQLGLATVVIHAVIVGKNVHVAIGHQRGAEPEPKSITPGRRDIARPVSVSTTSQTNPLFHA
jgi:hypothetical protein